MKRQSSKFPAFSIQTIFFPFFEDCSPMSPHVIIMMIKNLFMGCFLDLISVSKSCGV